MVENLDDPSAITKPVIRGYRETNGMAMLNGIHRVTADNMSQEILN